MDVVVFKLQYRKHGLMDGPWTTLNKFDEEAQGWRSFWHHHRYGIDKSYRLIKEVVVSVLAESNKSNR